MLMECWFFRFCDPQRHLEWYLKLPCSVINCRLDTLCYRPQRSVYDSVQRGVCPIACWDTPPTGTIGKHPPPEQTPPGHSACWEIRATSGQYASCWNAILLNDYFPVNKSEVFAKLTANCKCVTIVTLHQHLLLFKEQHITLFCRQKVNILHLFLISVENTRALIPVIRYRLNRLPTIIPLLMSNTNRMLNLKFKYL